MEIISQFEINGEEVEIQKQDNGDYDVFVNGINKQPCHDSDGIMRYLSNIIQNLDHKNKIKSKIK